MDASLVIVDGNNLLHKIAGLRASRRDFDSARWAVARALDQLTGEIDARITVVFDGTIGGHDEAFRSSRFEVVFSPANVTADTVIERMVTSSAKPEDILVITSDRCEQRMVAAAGAGTMSCEIFLQLVGERRDAMQRRAARTSKATPGATLGDFFP